ncbi:MAG: DUF3276 family protein [Saprospiraceae bacterium]|nr:PUR family DNA/RNA-binding protein [Bacteroidia bacterium]NNE15253.1 DUF3276 family protein [Saprospiraceae bacterium]NNL93109.1 DUF3276 family protein [Saprospiraceae bacterium]
MDSDNKFESVYSSKVRAGKRRTYFFDVRQTKGEDYYITITESTKRFDGNGYERHKIFLYKEDFNRFMNCLNDTVNHVKQSLMPDFDYELYERRQKEWEEKLALEQAQAKAEEAKAEEAIDPEPNVEEAEEPTSDEDMSW